MLVFLVDGFDERECFCKLKREISFCMELFSQLLIDEWLLSSNVGDVTLIGEDVAEGFTGKVVVWLPWLSLLGKRLWKTFGRDGWLLTELSDQYPLEPREYPELNDVSLSDTCTGVFVGGQISDDWSS